MFQKQNSNKKILKSYEIPRKNKHCWKLNLVLFAVILNSWLLFGCLFVAWNTVR